MSSSIEQIKDRLNIRDVVSSYITLEKSGRNFRARCPFHNERTPSFFISPERGTYHCFGCDKGGDIFEFVEAFEGVDFYSALKLLAAKAGVELERSNPRARDEKEQLYHVLDEAASFYQRVFVASPRAREYVKKRGITEESIKEWRLGFAPIEWRSLSSFFLAKGVREDALLKTGLIIRTDNGRYYDRFRGRIMFPISDSFGRVIAFSARLLDGENGAFPSGQTARQEAKYINSPETELYNKSSALYGFDKAKNAIREKNACVIVEGQTDVIITHQSGIRNTVATSGTALTEEHLNRICRFTEKLIFAFDADAAGLAATERALTLALTKGMEVAFVHLPKKMDPAELGVKSPKDLEERIENARHAVDFFLTALEENITDARQLKIETGKRVLPLIAHMKNRIEQAHFITETARRIGVREEVLWEEMRAVSAKTSGSVPGKNLLSAEGKDAREPRSRENTIAERLIGVLLWQKQKKRSPDPFLKNAEQELAVLLGASFKELTERLLPRDRERALFDAERIYGERVLLEDDIKELLRNLKESMIRMRLKSAMVELARAENAHNEARAEQISKEISTLTKSL